MRKEGDSSQNKKIVFMGTPWIATKALKALIDLHYEIVGVITQPDKVIKNKTPMFSPVKILALENGLKVFQPYKISEIKDELSALKPDMLVTCAYGQFIPDSILNIAPYGCFNAHASVLPQLRGGAPIHWAIINGFDKTGITIMKTVKKMDAGDIYSIYTIGIDNDDTTSSLTHKLGDVVYRSLLEQLPNIFNNLIQPIQQDESLVSFAYNITKEQEKINFNLPAINVCNWIRGLSDVPGGYALFNNKRVKLFKALVTNNPSVELPGTIMSLDKSGIYIATNDFDILVREIQLEGKERISYSKFHIGDRFFKVGMRFN